MSNIADRIDSIRIARGWTQYRIAKESGLPQSTIASWSDQKKNINPSVDSLVKIANAFGMTMSTLYADYSLIEEGAVLAISKVQLEMLQVLESYTPEQLRAFMELAETLKNN